MTRTIVLIVLAVALVALAPLALVWALNALFGLAIAYTLKTWLAALILGGAISASARRSSQ